VLFRSPESRLIDLEPSLDLVAELAAERINVAAVGL